jgi:hypothetical protein
MAKYRVLLKGGFLPDWASADQATKDRVTDAWVAFHAAWTAMGGRLVATLDDTLFRCGLPGGTKPWTFYEMWEIDRLEAVKEMLDHFRPQTPGALRVDRYFRVEAVVGTPIPPVEEAARRAEPA